MIKYKYIFIFFILLFLFNKDDALAGTYDNAYTFYSTHCSGGEPAYLNKNDGYIYFCSWGNKSVSGTKYKTVGYTISVNIDGNKDSIEVKLDGSIIKNVSTVTKDNVTYVLRRARLTRLQELFSGNPDITWYQIFKKKNTFEFDAIMTVSENGKDLCGKVNESSNHRRLNAENEQYLYKKLSGIKNARNWNNPADLNNFFNRMVEIVAVSPLEIEPVSIEGSNIYNNDNLWYVKENSACSLLITSVFNDEEAASSRYHPNYNVYRISGWGDDQKYCAMQGAKESSGKATIISDGNSDKKPLRIININKNKTSTSNDSYIYFTSTVDFQMIAPNAERIYIVPEGRVYYNNLYPDKETDEKNLCDIQSNSKGKLTIVSDGKAPQTEVLDFIPGFQGGYVPASGNVSDNGAGLKVVRLYRNDGVLLYEKNFSQYCRYYSISEEYSLKVEGDYSYYLYAMDNVGNETISTSYKIVTPKAHIVKANISGGINGYNGGNITANVFGGNSEINSFVIISEEDENPTKDRIIFANKSVEAHTLEKGLYQYNDRIDAMKIIESFPDGEYYFSVISGGRYIASEPVMLSLKKDVTPPEIRTIESEKHSCGWYGKKAVITMDVSDNYSGVKSIEAQCNDEYIDGTMTYDPVYDRYLKKYTITTDGNNKLVCVADDIAENISEEVIYVKVDALEPTYRLYGGFAGADTDPDRWISKEQLAGGIVLQDFQSGMLINKSDMPVMLNTYGVWRGLNEQYYNILQDDYNRVELKFTKNYTDNIKSSKNEYRLFVTDRVGNLLSRYLYINVDCDAPTLSYPDKDAWNGLKLSGDIIVSDIHSGVASIIIKCDDVIAEQIQTESCISMPVHIDLTDYRGKIKNVTVLVEDMVGNSAEYPLEVNIRNGGKIHTRIR